MKKATAYYNYGRWVVDCPEDGCADARSVYPVHPLTGVMSPRPNTEDVCANGHPFTIEMPPAQLAAQIVGVLSERAEDRDKGWYPKGHPAAIRDRHPSGQTVDELLEENRMVAEYRAQEKQRDDDLLRETLSGLGIEVRPDGTFSGRI